MSIIPTFCLTGKWRSDSIDCRNNSSSDFDIDVAIEEFGIKFKRKTILTITQVCREKEEILLNYIHEPQRQFFALSLEETNVVVVGGKSYYTIATSIGCQFESLVLTTLGNGGRRLNDEYILLDRSTLQVTSRLYSPVYGDAVVVRKYSRPAGLSLLISPFQYVGYSTVNNWAMPNVCDRSVLSALQIIVLNDSEGDSFRVKV